MFRDRNTLPILNLIRAARISWLDFTPPSDDWVRSLGRIDAITILARPQFESSSHGPGLSGLGELLFGPRVSRVTFWKHTAEGIHRGDSKTMDGAPQLELLLDLESRHEDLLDRLDELDKRVESVLAEFSPRAEPAAVATGQ